jgi:hypothetical protein
MKVITRQQLGQAAWDAAADSSPDAWLWHRYDVCDTAVRDWPGRTDVGFAVLGNHDEVQALVPAFVMRRRTSVGVSVRYLSSNGGPALAPTLGRSRRQQILETVATELRRLADAARASETTISLPTMAPALRGPECPRCSPLLSLGFENISGQTWVADLRCDVETAWKRLEGRARTSIRRAEEAGVTIRRSTSSEDWRPFFDLHKITYERLRVPSYPEALFRVIFEKLIPAGHCFVQFAELAGAPIAATNIACYKEGGYYWHGFSSEAGLRTNALTLLIWNGMKTLMQSGQLQWFDCGDAILHGSSKHRQLSDFKRSFGGELYPIFRARLNGTNTLYNRLAHLRALITGH